MVMVDTEGVGEGVRDGDETVHVGDTDEEPRDLVSDHVSEMVVDRVDENVEVGDLLGLIDQLGVPDWVPVQDKVGLGLEDQVDVADCLHDTVPLTEPVVVGDDDTVRVDVMDE